ncbi:MAG: hypothetical protein AAF363_21090 [Bacteroidota bacterium]
MKRYSIFALLIIMNLSCNNDDGVLPTPDSQFENFIIGRVNGDVVDYEQGPFSSNISNTYFPKSQVTRVQAYKNGEITRDGYWQVTLGNLDLPEIDLPFSSWNDSTNASLEWYDTSIVPEDDRCGIVDQGCTFSNSTDKGLELTITNLTDNLIEGRFSGRLFLTGTGFGAFRDESVFVDITNGSFKTDYRTTD